MSTQQTKEIPKWDPKYRGKDGLNTEERIVKARIKLLTAYPFFGNLALYLDLVRDEKCPTAYTDGKVIGYNPDFIDSMEDAEINWVVCHEVLHPALGHMWRRGTRTPRRANMAMDYAIHVIMTEMAKKHPQDFKMPKGCLYDAKYNEMAWEEIYETLQDEEQLKLQGGGPSGQGTLDSHDEWDEGGGSKQQEQEKEWQGRVISAAQQQENKMKGELPAGLARAIGKLTKPQKNWRQLLAEFVQFELFDYAFSPPDKRLYGMEDYYGDMIILPDYSEETSVIKELIFAIDTSGSIGDNEYNAFISEGVGLLNQFSNNVTGKVLYCDASVQAIYDLNDIHKSKPKGGGGTSFVPVFNWIEKYQQDNGLEVCGLVYLTDCYGDYPKQKPIYPVLWVSTTKLEQIEKGSWYPPFGTVTELKIGEND